MGYVSEIEKKNLLQVDPDGAAQLLADPELLCRTIMDCAVLRDSLGAKMEALSRNYLCFALASEKNLIIEWT